MSRHRSPGSRHAHPVTSPGAPSRRLAVQATRHRTGAAAVRNGMAAAAVTGGALALALPAMSAAVPAADAAADEATVLRLATDAERAAPAVAGRMVRLASVQPVVTTDAPPPEVDVADLLKAAGLADVARIAEKERADGCAADLDGLGPVKPWVRAAARFLSCRYGQPDLIGVAPRSRHSDHPSGLAVDFMTRGERGDEIAECALRNQSELGITYVIWKQRVNYGDGWERMSDRGGDTENHFDHVHISFQKSAPSGNPMAAVCS